MEKFEEYFRRADLDKDGRISGAEAVTFFQASNLPKPTLAQIWQHADQNCTGFLGRQEFFNALKLVTVAQSKRELTPDIVKAALYGPASSKIPAPQINLAALPPAQPNPMAPRPPTQQPGIVNSMAPRPPTQQPVIVNSMAPRPPTQQPGLLIQCKLKIPA
ncbi:epidermal growth factor receptor substrate 15-like protein 1 [Tanacetum coccineum]